MIPVRLTLKNFMSYRGACSPVDFTPLHTACLTGDNGAGKTALLTAMTWALWGEAPAHADDEDLIAQGETDMTVDFEFAIGDQQYRVLRARSRKGKTTVGKVDFQMATDGAGWRTITADNARATQRLITERLRMDHETFVNSAFLRQGKADEFTTKNPTERKEILAKILGLAEYDQLAERAREQARDRETLRRQLTVHIQELDRKIAPKADLQRQAAELTEYLAEARSRLALATSESERFHLLLAAAERDRVELENVRALAAQDEVEISKAEKGIAALDSLIKGYEETLSQRDTITAAHNRLLKLRERERELSELGQRSRELESTVHRLERAIDDAKNGLTNSITMHERTIAEQRRLTETQPAKERQLADVRAELALLAQCDEQCRTAQAELDQLQRRIAGLLGANEKLKEEADLLKHRLELFESSIAAAQAHQHNRDEPCPLCGGPLTADAVDRVRKSYVSDMQVRREQWKANTRAAAEVETRVVTLQAQVADLELRLRSRTMAQKREAALERDLQAAAEAQDRIVQEELALQTLRLRLTGSQYAVSEREELHATQAQLVSLAYDSGEHARLSAECRTLDTVEHRFADLRSAEDKLASDTARRAAERDRVAHHRTRLHEERAKEAHLTLSVGNLASLRQQSQERVVTLEQETERCERLSREQAANGRDLEGIADAEIAREGRSAELVRATAEKGIYEDLAKAFGKGGIQAMIIEQIVPELAEEANTLLGRMTDNRMQLTFETQKQAKSKDSTIETLDIKITDGAGIARKYEMFSGGEAFRINFAVRIALSKLLARRAGAQLQTLIIDEGFGTQDATGRERLVHAIRSIQPDFEKILVITHIDELKEEFASRIDVVKTASGSLATVN